MSTVPWMLAEWRKRIESNDDQTGWQSSDNLDGNKILAHLRSLKALLTGGAPIADDLALFFEVRGVKLLQSEGMTECSGSLFTGHPSDSSFRNLRMHPSIIYEWIPLDDSYLLDGDEQEEAEGGVIAGELVIADSPAVTKGYLNNDLANQKAFFWGPPAPVASNTDKVATTHSSLQNMPVVRKFRTGDVFKVLPGSEGRCVEYVCRVDDVLSLSTGEKMNPIAFEQTMRLHTLVDVDDDDSSAIQHKASRKVQLVSNVCLLGRNLPFVFAVIEPDYTAVEEAFRFNAATSSSTTKEEMASWLFDRLWKAATRVNEGWSSSCRVHREAIIVLSKEDEPLKISRKRTVYRVLAEKRFAEEMRQRCDFILERQTKQLQTQPLPQPTSSLSSLEQRQSTEEAWNLKQNQLWLKIWQCIADTLAIPLELLASQERSIDQPFASLGINSLLATQLAGQFSTTFGMPISPATLYTYPSVRQLAAFLLLSQVDDDRTNVHRDDRKPNGQLNFPGRVLGLSKEPIAVIGMSCRFPGGASNLDAYWQLVRDGIDCISEVPASRWDINSFYDSDSDAPGKMHTRKGGFVDATEYFDHQFFGISAKEAQLMDPRQRVG